MQHIWEKRGMNSEFLVGNPEENGRIGRRRASLVDNVEIFNQNLQEAHNVTRRVLLDQVKVLYVNMSP
jgi:hypothetical protein